MITRLRWTKREFCLGVLFLTIFLAGSVTPGQSQSLYYLANYKNAPTNVVAMDINEVGGLEYQKNVLIERFGDGAQGLAMDIHGHYLFTTHANSNRIQILDSDSMTLVSTVSVSKAVALAGIVFDNPKKRLYCVERGTETLYGFDWSAQFKQLTPMAGSPYTLPGAAGHGLALDEPQGILYVTNRGTSIRAYYTNGWSLARQIQLSRPALCIEIDAKNQMLYTGGGYMVDYYLVQYDLLFDMEKSVQITPFVGAADLAMDYEREWVYFTTGSIYGGDNGIMAYDIAMKRQLWQRTGHWPTGLVISSSTTGYNPLDLDHKIFTGTATIAEQHFAGPGDVVVYETRFANDRFGYPLQNVTARNTLPAELKFLRAELVEGTAGSYDPGTHSYVVRVPSLLPGARQAYRLVGQIRTDVPPDTLLRHSATVSATDLAPTTRSADLVVRYQYHPLVVAKTILNGATEVDGSHYGEPGADVVYEVTVSNEANPWPVSGVVSLDELPRQLQFVEILRPEDVNAVYHPDIHTLVYSVAQLNGGAMRRLQYKLHVPDSMTEDALAVNLVTVDSEQTDAVRAQVGLIITPSIKPLDLRVTLLTTPPAVGNPPNVTPGQQLVYQIVATNRNSFTTATDVLVRAEYATGLAFVNADPNNGLPEARIYTWRYTQLAPDQTVTALLTLKVNNGLPGGTPLMTDVKAYTAQTPTARVSYAVQTSLRSMRTVVTVVTSAGDIIYPGEVGCILAGEVFNYRVQVGNPDNAVPINNVLVQVNLPVEVLLLDTDPLGIYDPASRLAVVNYPVLGTNQEGVVDIRVQARSDLAVGIRFNSQVNILSQELPAYQASIEAEICDKAIEAAQTDVVYNPAYPTNQIIVTMILPPDIQVDSVDGTRGLILAPGNVLDSNPIVGGVDGRVKLRGFFDPGLVRAAAGGPGTVDVSIQGWLKNGIRFVGQGQVVFPD